MTSDPELAAAIDALMGTPLSIEDALRPPAESGLPDEPGLYAVWIHSSALAGLQAQPHPLDAEWRLLYLGIAPARATSSQLLRSRVVGNHLRGNTGASTLRLSLAALLMDELGLQPLQRRKKVVLSKTQNDALSAWQRDNLALTWAVRSEPWSVEHVVIADLSPPLNLDGNATHPYHPILSQARADFRATATARDST